MPFDTPASPLLRTEDMPNLRLKESGKEAIMTGADFSLVLDKEKGQIVSLKYKGYELMRNGPLLNVWRAPTDNDVPRMAPKWRRFGLDRIEHRVKTVKVKQVSPQAVRITVAADAHAPNIADGFDYKLNYTIYGSSDIVIEADVAPSEKLPPLPRIGLEFRIPEGYETFTWFGRGPHENYQDRKEGAPVGLYSGTVDDQYVPYIKPQDNGNKTDVRWASLANKEGVGLLAVGMPLMEVSAHHFTTDDLAKANHTSEVKRQEDITLNLDYKQSGLGGGSCGPDTLPKYQIKPEPVHFSVRLRPLSKESSAMKLSK